MTAKLYMASDVGPSGHGTVGRGFINHLLNTDLELTVRSQQWGLNRAGFVFDRGLGDNRFKERLLRSDRLNDDYLASHPREIEQRRDDLLERLGTASTIASEDCIVKEIPGDEDVWLSVGPMGAAEQAPDHAYTIVETDWNLDAIPYDWQYYAEQCDEIWVPNEWNRKAFEKRGVTDNVRVMPYGIDFSYRATQYDCHSCGGTPPNTQGRHPHTYPEIGSGNCLDDDRFTFVTVARWYHIKGIGRLLEAFLREFSPYEGDDVRLFVKTTMNNQAPISGQQVGQAIQQLAERVGAASDTPEVGIRTDSMSNQELMDLYGVADCFALPSRAECVGIAWAEAMHAGTPVITTNWSAMGEYLTDDHALLVDGDVERPQPEYPWLTYSGSADYPPDSKWLTPDMQELQNALRRAYEGAISEDMTENARNRVHDLFDWERHGKARVERIQEVVE